MQSRDRFGARRRYEVRPVLPVIIVVCDDTKTAVSYFELLKHEVKDRCTVRVYGAPHCGADANEVMAFALSKAPEAREPNDQIFVLIDLDTNPDENEIRRAGNAAGVKPALSKPCYEVWTLAHLEDTGESFLDCDAVVKRIATKWRELFDQEFGRKAQADYSKLMAMRGDAIQRCKRRNKSTSPSWTEVWLVVEAIIS
jgi:hypothetical protein